MAISKTVEASDSFDATIDAWKAILPELDTDAFAIFGRIHFLARHWFRRLERFGERYNIAPGEVYVMLALRRTTHPLTPTELYRALSITSGTITKRVDRLVAAGLVERVDAENARSVKVRLTRKGQRAIDDGLVFSSEYPLHALRRLQAGERRQLIGFLRILLSDIERNADSED